MFSHFHDIIYIAVYIPEFSNQVLLLLPSDVCICVKYFTWCGENIFYLLTKTHYTIKDLEVSFEGEAEYLRFLIS
jgi:hypothetical protein